MKKLVLSLLLIAAIGGVSVGQSTIDIRPILAEIDDDFFYRERALIEQLKSVPYNPERDTIYAFEQWNIMNAWGVELCYWSSRFAYSVLDWHCKPKRSDDGFSTLSNCSIAVFDRQLLSDEYRALIEHWEDSLIRSRASQVLDYSPTCQFSRIIFDQGQHIVESFIVYDRYININPPHCSVIIKIGYSR